ncbi:MAG: hypothetical protein WA261_19630 [Candidatus Sulfotelmatobacter sp.]
MQLKPFLLDMWLDTYEHDIECDLAASEGPRWTLNEILELAGEEERERFLNHKLRYSRPAGAEGLRAAIAEMQDVDVETVQVVTGASEALLILFWLAAEPRANVVLPTWLSAIFRFARIAWDRDSQLRGSQGERLPLRSR